MHAQMLDALRGGPPACTALLPPPEGPSRASVAPGSSSSEEANGCPASCTANRRFQSRARNTGTVPGQLPSHLHWPAARAVRSCTAPSVTLLPTRVCHAWQLLAGQGMHSWQHTPRVSSGRQAGLQPTLGKLARATSMAQPSAEGCWQAFARHSPPASGCAAAGAGCRARGASSVSSLAAKPCTAPQLQLAHAPVLTLACAALLGPQPEAQAGAALNTPTGSCAVTQRVTLAQKQAAHEASREVRAELQTALRAHLVRSVAGQGLQAGCQLARHLGLANTGRPARCDQRGDHPRTLLLQQAGQVPLQLRGRLLDLPHRGCLALSGLLWELSRP